MTQEQKAKAYDEALERARAFYNSASTNPITEKEVLVAIFPELRESEDERIRKWLIGYFNQYIIDGMPQVFGNGLNVKDVIAWLEKQEQKPIDKFEPKFHKGDWITNRIETVQITGYDIDYGYQVNSKGNLQHRDTDILEKEYHLWTIQDAKDGDVLVEDSCIFIIQKLGDNSTAAKTYCTLYNDGDFDDGTILYFDIDSTNPATKEQRDLLFQKMKEAGYEWDAEKKELKTIEHNVQLTEFEDAIKDMMNDYNDAIGNNDATIEEIKKHAAYLLSLIHQKPAWSEEDEKNLKKAVWYVENPALNVVKDIMLSEWLKSLKDRVQPQPKQDWSEEDEKMIDRVKESLNCFIDSLEENTDLEDDTRLSLIGNVKNEIKWVESLKDKTKWKPNTEDNKPSIKHSVLMKTVNGIAEGEWQGDDLWYQYRWCSRLKDSDVLAWMELSDLKGISYGTIHR